MEDPTNPVSLPKRGLGHIFLASLRGARARRQAFAEWLTLSPARYTVGVQTKLRIPMPDKVELLADHYYPKAAGDFPCVLIRTPLGRRWEKLPFSFAYMFAAQRFAERGYHVIVQSARVKPLDDFLPDNEEADGMATVEWIARQPWFNGALGMWGQSFLGFVQWGVAQHAPPYLKAIVPAMTTANFRSLFYDHDTFTLANVLTVLSWFAAADRPLLRRFRSSVKTLREAFDHLPVGEADVVVTGRPVQTYRNTLAYPGADDPYWRDIDLCTGRADVVAPAHLIGGWYDIFLPDLLDDYTTLRDAGREPFLTIGPWSHLDVAGAMTTLREGLRWFAVHLRGEAPERQSPVHLYVMGAQHWLTLPSWPPPALPSAYYLHPQHSLALAAVSSDDAPPDHYVYDPQQPTPATGGAHLLPTAGRGDDTLVEERGDALTYTSAPLDAELTIIGAPHVTLYVCSSAQSADFVARLCDVTPDGRSLHVTDALTRISSPAAAQACGEVRRLDWDLWPTAYQFHQGHRIRLVVTSGAHPRWARNLGTGESLSTATQAIRGEYTIYHDALHPSCLRLPVVD